MDFPFWVVTSLVPWLSEMPLYVWGFVAAGVLVCWALWRSKEG